MGRGRGRGRRRSRRRSSDSVRGGCFRFSGHLPKNGPQEPLSKASELLVSRVWPGVLLGLSSFGRAVHAMTWHAWLKLTSHAALLKLVPFEFLNDRLLTVLRFPCARSSDHLAWSGAQPGAGQRAFCVTGRLLPTRATHWSRPPRRVTRSVRSSAEPSGILPSQARIDARGAGWRGRAPKKPG